MGTAKRRPDDGRTGVELADCRHGATHRGDRDYRASWPRMKLGIGTYSYMWAIGFDGARPASPMTAMALLEKARGLGVRVVQYGPNLSLESLSEVELDDL